MQGTWVWALVQEDPTCRGATKPVRHNYWACALEPASHNYWALVPQLLKPAPLEPVLHKRSHCSEELHTATKSSPRSPQLEKARVQQRRPNTAKINKHIFKKTKKILQTFCSTPPWLHHLSLIRIFLIQLYFLFSFASYLD